MSDAAKVSCREASKLLSLASERPLEPSEQEALRRHLEACGNCRNFEVQLRFIQRAAREFGAS
jgi:hypothetical protein